MPQGLKKKIMQNIIDFLHIFGINMKVNESSSPILIFACVILVLGLVCLLCSIQIVLYIAVLYITANELLLSRFQANKYVYKFINIFRKIS